MMGPTPAFLTSLTIVIILIVNQYAYAGTQKRPPEPSPTVPVLDIKSATIVCVSCAEPFEFPGHEEANEQLLGNKYVQMLRQAMYLQDTYHQFESRAHFDNCAFKQATHYISDLLDEVDAHIKSAQQSEKSGRKDDEETYGSKAFFAIGQTLHAVQDFFAHSNYVELINGKVSVPSEIPLIRPWVAQDIQRITEWQKKGLVSGYVFWGFPQKCPKGVPSHRDLAKDSATTKSGQVLLPHLENLSQYKIALFLAREASKDFLEYAFTRWPLLARLNGKYVAFEIFQERRGL